MITSELYGRHPHYDRMTFIFTLKTTGRTWAIYKKVRLTSKQKREAKKEFRAFLKSGLNIKHWIERQK